jgi:UDP-N-acetylmuramyl tripeptide synthase
VSVSAHQIELEGTRCARFALHTPAGTREIALPLPGLYNVYNALGATALCLALGVGLDEIAAGLKEVNPAFGRAERIAVGDVDLAILLIKNPAGANEILRTLALEPGELDLLGVLNDRTADGRDISWIWDADFELLEGHVRRVTCAGTRADELALRLKYAGIGVERIEVVGELAPALDRAIDDAEDRLFVLPTYTALLALRDELSRRGHVAQFWDSAPGGRG